MSIYIFSNGQQSGPFDEETVRQKLASGEFSPNDQGIRHGESAWQSLGQMFGALAQPQAIPPAAALSAPPQAANFMTADPPAAKGKGCRHALGWLILIGGILGFLGGAAGATASFVMPQPDQCNIADEAKIAADKALKEYEAAKGSPLEDTLEKKATDKVESFGIWSKSCAEALGYYRMWRMIFIVTAAIGFLGAIIGFFLRR